MKQIPYILKQSLKSLTLALLVSTSFSSVFAQQKKDKIKQLKIAYFTEELDLTSSESEKFWPIYNEFEDKTKTLRKENKKLTEEIKTNVESLSDEDIRKKTDKIFENQSTEISLRKEYHHKIAAVIGYKKSVRILHLENEFKKKLLEELRQGKPGQGKPHGPPRKPQH